MPLDDPHDVLILWSLICSLSVWVLGSRGWAHSIARPWVPTSSPLTHRVHHLPFWSYLASSKSGSARPPVCMPVRPGYDDKYRFRFVERHGFCIPFRQEKGREYRDRKMASWCCSMNQCPQSSTASTPDQSTRQYNNEAIWLMLVEFERTKLNEKSHI